MRAGGIFQVGYRSATWPEPDGTQPAWQIWFIKQLLAGLSLWCFFFVFFLWCVLSANRGVKSLCGSLRRLTNWCFAESYYCCLCMKDGERDELKRLDRPCHFLFSYFFILFSSLTCFNMKQYKKWKLLTAKNMLTQEDTYNLRGHIFKQLCA